jgi:hypothetical protein
MLRNGDSTEHKSPFLPPDFLHETRKPRFSGISEQEAIFFPMLMSRMSPTEIESWK